MSIPPKRRVKRIIEKNPCFTCFKPSCWKKTGQIYLLVDEYEAMRLCDLEKLSMQQWAEKMGISPATFNRMVTTAHRKITDALVHGKIICIHTCEEE